MNVVEQRPHLTARRAWGTLNYLFVRSSEYVRAGGRGCFLSGSPLATYYSPTSIGVAALPSCFSVRAMSPPWSSAIRFQRRHRWRRRRRMLPCSADGARDGDGVGDDGREKPARGGGKEGRKEGGRQEGGGGRQPPRQSPKTTLTTANGGGGGGGAYSLTRSLARSLAVLLCGATRGGGGGGNQAD